MTSSTINQWYKNMTKRPVLAVTLSVLWLILIGSIGYFWHLGSIGLIDETEPLFAEASRQMLVTGDWITPFFNGETRFDKPALIYWTQAIAYALIGVNEWAVRLPSALAAMGLISLAFYTLVWQQTELEKLESRHKPYQRWWVAGLCTGVMALNPEMIVWGRTGVSDMLLTGCIGSALLCFFLGYGEREPVKDKKSDRQTNSERTSNIRNTKKITKKTNNTFTNIINFFPYGWYLGFYILIAAAVLTKGPVGIVLPGLIVIAFLLYLGQFKQVWQEARPLGGLLIIFSLVLPWYILVALRNHPSFIDSFFGYHNVERFTSVVNRHSAPWYFYFVVVLLGFAPYSIYLPVAIAKVKFWQRKYWMSQPRSQQLGLFAFIWFAAIFSFFTIAVTKLPSYVLPLMPAAAILIALLWSEHINSPKTSKISILWSGWVNVAFLSALAVVLFYIPKIIGADPAAPEFRKLLQNSGLPVLGSIIWLLCALLVGFLLVRRQWKSLITANIIGFSLFMIFLLTPALFLMDRSRQLPLRELSAIAVEAKKPGEEIVMVGFKKPTVVFYTQHPVTFIKQNQAAGDYLQKPANQQTKVSSILMIAQPKKFPEMGLESSDYQDLGTRGAYQLIRVPLQN
ncbi:MAG: glycosyltransferase family 39 protein [Cyanobacteria bacterium P01_A01_bin.84]